MIGSSSKDRSSACSSAEQIISSSQFSTMETLTGEHELPVSSIPCHYLSPRYTSSEGTLDHSSKGHCTLTTYRLLYVPTESSHALPLEYFDIPLGSIRKIRLKKNAIIQLKTKDLRKVEFLFELDVVKQVSRSEIVSAHMLIIAIS